MNQWEEQPESASPSSGKAPPGESPAIDARSLVAAWLFPTRDAIVSLEDRLVAWVEAQASLLSDTPGQAAFVDDTGELARLQEEVHRLQAENAELESRAAEAKSPEDLQRLYDIACEEIRELKSKLDSQPAPAAVEDEAASLDWEAAKQRLIAQLEAEDGITPEDRGKMERLVAETDEAIAQRDAEIQRLQQQLEASGAKDAIEDFLAGDELVTQERERLAELQREWEEKLRKAEIEISIERAKIAREKSEIADRLRQLEEQLDDRPASEDGNEPPSRGRWLARLGLTEE